VRILIVGSGGREHAIAWSLKQSSHEVDLMVAPGNAGTAAIATNISIDAANIPGIVGVARDRAVDLTVVGPEIPLSLGLVDALQSERFRVVGPSRAAARLESSKVFAKLLMEKNNVPTASAKIFDDPVAARRYCMEAELPLVVKADGLAAGKGVTVCDTRSEALDAITACMETRLYGDAGARILIEECLQGREISVFAFVDGENLSTLVPACDYKRLHDQDMGPNTGGMGSYSPPEFWSRELAVEVRDRIMKPVIEGLASDGHRYQGILYAGLMLTDDGPKVLEFNCRLGDPEAQVLLPRLKSSFIDVLMAVAEGRLDDCPLEWRDSASVGVVMVSGGYPGNYSIGYPISGLEDNASGALCFHSGTSLLTDRGRDGGVVTSGGRVLTIVGQGETLADARRRAYDKVASISFCGSFYRSDIGQIRHQ
jgi:phosphoribosylamine--glycine ligase